VAITIRANLLVMCCFGLLGNFRENVSDLLQANAGHAFKVNPTFRSHRWRRAGCPNSSRRTWRRSDHPVGCHFSGCGWWHYRYSFGRRSNRSRHRTSDLRPQGYPLRIVHMLAHCAMWC